MSGTTTRLSLPYPSSTDAPNGAAQIESLATALDTPTVIFSSGTAASRPAAPTTGDGTIYFATDTGELSWYTGSAWIDIGPAVTHLLAAVKGDILVASGVGAFAALAPGVDGQVLTARSTAANGVDWEAAGGAVGHGQRVAITTANTWQTIASYTPSANALLQCQATFLIPAGGASVAMQVLYTSGGNSETLPVAPTGGSTLAQGVWSTLTALVDADSATAVDVQVQSSSTSTVPSAVIMEA